MEKQHYSANLRNLTKEERSLLLQKKREELHKKLQEKRKRELYEGLETLQLLKINKEPYLLLDRDSEEAKEEDNWFFTHFPGDFWRLKWEEFPHSSCCYFEDTVEAIHIIKEFCKNFPDHDQITISWKHASFPILTMDLEIVLKYIDTIIEDNTWDLWIFNKSRKWCIEVYHEDEVCIGYSPIQD